MAKQGNSSKKGMIESALVNVKMVKEESLELRPVCLTEFPNRMKECNKVVVWDINLLKLCKSIQSTEVTCLCNIVGTKKSGNLL